MERELELKHNLEGKRPGEDKTGLPKQNMDVLDLSDVAEIWKNWRAVFKEVVDGIIESQ